MVLSIPSTFAVSKSESQYTGPPLLEYSKNAGHWLGVAAKCKLGSKYDIRNEVGKLSWEDYKKFNTGYGRFTTAWGWAGVVLKGKYGDYQPGYNICNFDYLDTEIEIIYSSYLKDLNKALDQKLNPTVASTSSNDQLQQVLNVLTDIKDGSDQTTTNLALKEASEEAEKAKQKAAELEQQLAQLKKQEQEIQNKVSLDNQAPLIDIATELSSDKQGIIKGRVTDNVGIAEVTLDGQTIPIDKKGNFEYKTFIPPNGLTLTIEAFDLAGLSSVINVPLQRNTSVTKTIAFDPLIPIGRSGSQNNNALALIMGVSNYKNTAAKAIYADSDAKMSQTMHQRSNDRPHKTLVNDGADNTGVLLDKEMASSFSTNLTSTSLPAMDWLQMTERRCI